MRPAVLVGPLGHLSERTAIKPFGGDAVFIRGTNPAQFRSGEWARLVSMTFVKPPEIDEFRLCFNVRFADDTDDSWLVYGSGDEYEFSVGVREAYVT